MARYLGVEPVRTSPFYFLSYNSEDQARVREYAVALTGKGIPLWYDEGIEAGSKFEQSIAAHMKDCEAVVMFFSKGIFQKKDSFVYKEYEMAREYYDKRVIVVLLDQIAKRDVPIQYVVWWIGVTKLHCINAWDFSSPADCAARIAQALGIAAAPEMKTIRYNSGTVYEGGVVSGKPSGRGKKTWPNGDVYEGDWIDGKITGRGKYTWADGEVYEGDWVDNKRHGKGRNAYVSGNVYDGGWVNDKRHGRCKYTFANGEVYEGDFTDDKRTGKGKYLWPNGNVYEGDFVDDKCHGRGKYTSANGNVYEGNYIDDKKAGKGKYTWADGDVYEGDFTDGKITGKGKYTWPDGKVYVGDWVDGKRHGWGTFTSADGRVLKKGQWKDDKFVG